MDILMLVGSLRADSWTARLTEATKSLAVKPAGE